MFRPLHHVIAALLAAVICVGAFAYPKPAAVPYRWQLNFQPGDLRLFVDPVDGRAYWYFTYTVTNRTGSDQLWAPTFTLFTDEGEILYSGRDLPTRVENAIRVLLGNDLMETQNEVIGDLLQGREHAKDGLVVWAARNTSVNEVSLFAAGISGETARVLNPLTGQEMILRKTLHRRYLVRGDALARRSKPVELIDEEWVLR
jgi:hypothetical protein